MMMGTTYRELARSHYMNGLHMRKAWDSMLAHFPGLDSRIQKKFPYTDIGAFLNREFQYEHLDDTLSAHRYYNRRTPDHNLVESGHILVLDGTDKLLTGSFKNLWVPIRWAFSNYYNDQTDVYQSLLKHRDCMGDITSIISGRPLVLKFNVNKKYHSKNSYDIKFMDNITRSGLARAHLYVDVPPGCRIKLNEDFLSSNLSLKKITYLLREDSTLVINRRVRSSGLFSIDSEYIMHPGANLNVETYRPIIPDSSTGLETFFIDSTYENTVSIKGKTRLNSSTQYNHLVEINDSGNHNNIKTDMRYVLSNYASLYNNSLAQHEKTSDNSRSDINMSVLNLSGNPISHLVTTQDSKSESTELLSNRIRLGLEDTNYDEILAMGTDVETAKDIIAQEFLHGT